MDISSFLGGNFLTQLDLPQPYQVWTITKVDQQMVGQGQQAEQKICTAFAEHRKPLALNKTNLRRIAELYGRDANRWTSQQMLVYRSRTTFGNESRLCVRVCGPAQVPTDPVFDQQGNAVQFQATAQLATTPTQPPPTAPLPATPVAAPQPATLSQPVNQAPPWQQNDSGPAGA